MWAVGREKTSAVLPSCEHYKLQYQLARQDVPTCAIGLLDHWLDLSSVAQEGTHAWYCKPGQKHTAGEDIDPNGEPTAVV